MTNYFKTLNEINVNDHTEKKNNLTYLSWAWAWAEVKKIHPDATYTVYENADGWNYFTDGKTCWVKTGVTINGIEHIEYLPVMDFRNKSIPLNDVTSFDVNKTIQRSLTKACARHGLGLYIYAGEDLPEGDTEAVAEVKKDLANAKRAHTNELKKGAKELKDGLLKKAEATIIRLQELDKIPQDHQAVQYSNNIIAQLVEIGERSAADALTEALDKAIMKIEEIQDNIPY